MLLLDEVEKADGSFFDLLLQALGEARLTDAGGRLADFRNTVVVLTSNLGAESYRRGSAGFVSAAAGTSEAHEHFAKAVEAFLRPEMFNRLDRVVPFAPLGTDVIRQIADREWHKVLHRDGVRFRELNLGADAGLLDHLARVGFDPRYGARPLKRAMERELLAPLARQMNRHAGDAPLSVSVGLDAGAPVVSVKPLQGARSKGARDPGGPAGRLAAEAQAFRRWHQRLAASSVVRELSNDVFQLAEREKKILKKQLAKKKVTEEEARALADLGRLRELADAVARQRAEAFALEDAAVIAFHETAEPAAELPERLASAGREWDKLLLRLYALSAPSGDRITLALYSEHRGHLVELARAYRGAAGDNGLSVEMMRYDLPADGDPYVAPPAPPTPPPRNPDAPAAEPEKPKPVWEKDRLWVFDGGPAKYVLKRTAVPAAREHEYTAEGTVGLALSVSGAGAFLRFRTEGGQHAIKSPDPDTGDNPNVMSVVTGVVLAAYQPPLSAVRRGWFRDADLRREYDLVKREMHDGDLERVWSNLDGGLTAWVAEALDANVRAQLLKMIVE